MKKSKKRPSSIPWKFVSIVAVIVVTLTVGTLIGSMGDDDPATPSPTGDTAASPTTDPLAELARRDANDPLAMGEVDAPVVLIEYADFTCKYCGAFAENTLPALIEEYVEPGHVRIEWRDTPILSEDSVTTAIAGRAAARQGLFWEYYEVIYAHTFSEAGDYSRAVLLELVGQIDGLDIETFTADLDDPKLATAVNTEGTQSRGLGVSSTPTFVVGDQVLQGAQPIEVFRDTIDLQLDAAGR
ncbi:protein-disulfide isomerase [Stackebrandtia endophytica]|uniref:Protein-disulfide isomerase n=1 Tax=Stackebrandtia endophytica TaxID=1496996 RepID=A0A543B109_9ACTN|nr:thioredoxin domain-containing protein [Stackebrandtia endophytica]TQL78513.1 protein-disulfide isomerase [Stackebrandtia endophytica]